MSSPEDSGRLRTGDQVPVDRPAVPPQFEDAVVDEAARRFEGVRADDFAVRPTESGTTPALSSETLSSEAPSPEAPSSRTVPSGAPSTGASTADRDGQDAPPPTMWEQMGGPMGMVDSGVPVLVFIIANTIGGLGWGIGTALGAGLLIAILRLLRKQPITQAIGGLFGVGIAAFIASRTGEARGFFLLGIWTAVVYGSVVLLSIIVRWPLVGVLWESLNGRGTAWRSDKRLVRLYDYATAVWVVVFALRFVVQQWLYDDNQVGWLAAAKIALGTPLFLIAIVVTVLIVGSAAGMQLPGWMNRRRKA